MCFGPSWTLGKLNNLGSYWALFYQRQPCVLMQKNVKKRCQIDQNSCQNVSKSRSVEVLGSSWALLGHRRSPKRFSKRPRRSRTVYGPAQDGAIHFQDAVKATRNQSKTRQNCVQDAILEGFEGSSEQK